MNFGGQPDVNKLLLCCCGYGQVAGRFTAVTREQAQESAVIVTSETGAPDACPKGTGIVVFEAPDDARNAIQQFNGYDWAGPMWTAGPSIP
ncbi:hypothetical protein SMACR_08012 [Sordaria macrospora]|uniref:WGS project CABT00000000 data, contig 2.13 n=2 Tax=Sordaria macrospora TaxID=5147 RepID=F7VY66_SORMK|nr:uncharacterized protein SMAC_08012 [Sordaria macrospora k-hell]KAA8632605.1 hypothetical protein SMACR_08012 [Sordaria macrospora]WPJ62902.1 hypothetical protein SMAC4_08012 [Sordaria macrospora]CCC10460.1 unnamed protein product [Sordaria macrospora k-hell]